MFLYLVAGVIPQGGMKIIFSTVNARRYSTL